MYTDLPFFDVAVVGAGFAGLICAQKLQQQGLKVVVLDKSKGVGGRVATRRLENTCVDHGLAFLEVQGKHTEKLIEKLSKDNIIQLWHGQFYQLEKSGELDLLSENRYIATPGMNAIAKYLATGLEIQRQSQVIKISHLDNWLLEIDSGNQLLAKALVIAIPAPQALSLVQTCSETSPELIEQLNLVEVDPCIAVMVGYNNKYQQELNQCPWQAINIKDHTDLAKIIVDSSKREISDQPIFVLHSTAEFAHQYLENTSLQPVAKQLLNSAAQLLFPWLNNPDWLVVHRWRYALTKKALGLSCLTESKSLPLVCCGDWCLGNQIEDALISGLDAAVEIIKRYYPQ